MGRCFEDEIRYPDEMEKYSISDTKVEVGQDDIMPIKFTIFNKLTQKEEKYSSGGRIVVKIGRSVNSDIKLNSILIRDL